MSSQQMNRRDFLRSASVGAAALMFGGGFETLSRRAPLLTGGAAQTGLAARLAQMEPFVPDAEISITAAPKTVQILSGAPTTPISWPS